jgi:flagellar hook assembly protein FlgD
VDITVTWPSGIEQTLNQVSANQRLTIEEQAGTTDVNDTPIPREFFVENYPNPFNPSTTLHFGLPGAAEVTIDIFDVQGRRVRTLAENENFPAGEHQIRWQGRDDRGRVVNSGVYLYRVRAGEHQSLGRMTLLK